jgi:hypothetical protein
MINITFIIIDIIISVIGIIYIISWHYYYCYFNHFCIDFIFTSNFSSSSFKYENNTLTVYVDKIYGKNPTDYEKVRKDCYMLIQKDPSKARKIGQTLLGYKISYVPKLIADTALPGKR